MIKRKALFSFLLLFFVATLKAQPTLDTIKYCLTQKPHLFLKFDNRNSFIENSRAKIFGVVMGINYGNRLYFGIGYNQLYPPTTNFDEKFYFVNHYGKKDSVIEKLKLFYISVEAEYVFYQTKDWQLSMPLQIGIGDTYYKYTMEGVKTRADEKLSFVYEPAVSIEYKPFKWAGVGADLGYRFMIAQNRKLNQKFTSPIYAFKILIYYSEIYNYFFRKVKGGNKKRHN